MPKWIDRLLGKDNANTAAGRRAMIKKLDGRTIKYVTERPYEQQQGDTTENYAAPDVVVGRAGALTVKNDELLVFSSSDVVFRGKIEEIEIGELMSREGVIITGKDLQNDNRPRHIVAYYTYYIK